MRFWVEVRGAHWLPGCVVLLVLLFLAAAHTLRKPHLPASFLGAATAVLSCKFRSRSEGCTGRWGRTPMGSGVWVGAGRASLAWRGRAVATQTDKGSRSHRETPGNKAPPSALPSPPRPSTGCSQLPQVGSLPGAAGAEGRSVRRGPALGGVTGLLCPRSAAHSAAAGGNCQSSRAPSRRAAACGTPGRRCLQASRRREAASAWARLPGAAPTEHRPETMAPSRCENREMPRAWLTAVSQEHRGLRPPSWASLLFPLGLHLPRGGSGSPTSPSICRSSP